MIIFESMRIAKLIAALVVVLALLGIGYYFFGNYSDGYRAGTVMKLSKKGLLFKTYEGELNLGMIMNESNNPVSVSNIWPFSVPANNEETLKKLDTAMMSGKRAKLHYREKFIAVPWRGDTKYIVYKVELGD